jgi:16S rRNA (cytosine967-C5)-methyltransferase
VQIEGFLARNPQLKRERLTVTDVFGRAEFLNPQGDLRTLPQMLPDPDPRWGGMDGFFAARLIRTD